MTALEVHTGKSIWNLEKGPVRGLLSSLRGPFQGSMLVFRTASILEISTVRSPDTNPQITKALIMGTPMVSKALHVLGQDTKQGDAQLTETAKPYPLKATQISCPEPGARPTSRSTSRFYCVHPRSIGVQNWGFYFLDPPGGHMVISTSNLPYTNLTRASNPLQKNPNSFQRSPGR